MATPSSFDESNFVLDKPSNMSYEECECLSVSLCKIGDHPGIMSCWKLSEEELAEVNRTGRIWLTILGRAHPAVIIDGIKPEFGDTSENFRI